MTWNSWVLGIAANADAPPEWQRILEELSSLLSSKNIDKIELSAFSIRGRRTARWLISPDDSEFSTLQDSLGAAKKLTWLLLKSEGAPAASDTLMSLLKCTKSTGCELLEGHTGDCSSTTPSNEITKCPLCLERIKFSDFNLDGRTDPLSIQMGHLVPLSRATGGHTAINVDWAHRRCNYIQDEQTVEETIQNLRNIVRKHGYTL